MGHFNDLTLSRTAEDDRLDRLDGIQIAPPAVEAVIAACLRTLRDPSPATRAALTAGLDLSGPPAGLRHAIERRCREVVDLLAHGPSPHALAVAARPQGRAPHVAYAGRRIAAARAASEGIPLVVDGRVVGVAGDLPEAERWLARFEVALAA